MMACNFSSSSEEKLRVWLRRFPRWDLGRREEIAGFDALRTACLSNADPPTLRLLLEANSSPWSLTDIGGSALMVLAKNPDCDVEKVTILLEATGRDPSYINQRLLPQNLKWRLLMGIGRLAFCAGSKNKVLLEMATWKGVTSLHYAAMAGDVDVCQVLLEARADPTIRNAIGMTPLEAARFSLSGKRRGGQAAALEECLAQGHVVCEREPPLHGVVPEAQMQEQLQWRNECPREAWPADQLEINDLGTG